MSDVCTGIITGKAGEFSLGGADYQINKWELNPKVELHVATNTKSEGHEQYTVGIDSAEGSITFMYDPDDSAISHLIPGSYHEDLNLKFNEDKGFTSINIVVEGLTAVSPVDGVVECTFAFKACGWDYASNLAAL